MGECKKDFSKEKSFYGAKEIRTPDPNAASVVLYQLSYNPVKLPKLRKKIFFCQGDFQ